MRRIVSLVFVALVFVALVGLAVTPSPVQAQDSNLKWAAPSNSSGRSSGRAPSASPPPLPSNPTQAPIDGGLAWLAVAGGAYAVRRLRSRKGEPDEDEAPTA